MATVTVVTVAVVTVAVVVVVRGPCSQFRCEGLDRNVRRRHVHS